jgi:hypothetical protein
MNSFSRVLLMESWCTQELSSIVLLWSVIHVICEYVQHINPLPSYVAPIRLHVAVSTYGHAGTRGHARYGRDTCIPKYPVFWSKKT